MFQKIVKAVLVVTLLATAISNFTINAQTSPVQIVASDDPKGGTGSG